jgi:hypothetical protein
MERLCAAAEPPAWTAALLDRMLSEL